MRSFNSSSLVALCALFALTTACVEPMDPASRVVSFRVLAEQADAPYAAAGETVQITTLSHDPQARPVSWAWASCVNPSSSSIEGCVEKIAEDSAATGTFPLLAMGEGLDSLSFPVPGDVLDAVPDAARPAASVGVLSAACPGTLTLEQGPAGLPFRCVDVASGEELGLDEFVIGLKRISLRSTDRNQNPDIASVTFDGADWPATEIKEVGYCDSDDNDYAACSKGNKHQLAAQPSADSFESGTDEFGRPFEEQVIVQYFATEGIFENEIRIGREPKTGFVARKAASGQELRLWFVTRDDRGGVSWTERRVQVR
jgi:hypothetical protein